MTSYYPMSEWKFIRYVKANEDGKMYSAVLENRSDRSKKIRINFGSTKHFNYSDNTGLNLYPSLIHADEDRKDAYRKRHSVYIKPGMFSAGYFAWRALWT